MMTGAPGGAAPPGGAEPTVFPTRLLPAAVLVGVACALGAGVAPVGGAASDPIPSPEQFFGFPMGAEGRLAHWDRIVDYFTLVGARSDRVAVRESAPAALSA